MLSYDVDMSDPIKQKKGSFKTFSGSNIRFFRFKNQPKVLWLCDGILEMDWMENSCKHVKHA